MGDQDLDGDGWDDAVSEASKHVLERTQAKEQVAERQKPRAEGPKIAVLALVLLGVVAWNVHVLTGAPRAVPREDERQSLPWFVSDAVDLIEDFRVDMGRLPDNAEAIDLLDEDVVYETRGDGYFISVSGDRATIEYLSVDDFSTWLAIQTDQGGGS